MDSQYDNVMFKTSYSCIITEVGWQRFYLDWRSKWLFPVESFNNDTFLQDYYSVTQIKHNLGQHLKTYMPSTLCIIVLIIVDKNAFFNLLKWIYSLCIATRLDYLLVLSYLSLSNINTTCFKRAIHISRCNIYIC